LDFLSGNLQERKIQKELKGGREVVENINGYRKVIIQITEYNFNKRYCRRSDARSHIRTMLQKISCKKS
jgi:hypothetical protein